ncbi:DMT family transporter [Mesorhizobium sp. YIM 152430]|jgi:drug/metabolite transporter (DMT)-like permease|uniref:DMT family transporter n=1 Tax=Mesorhizobium sp. YIM 152430 TaxID=3031761 RepID=UPI0023DCC3FC|nr:DMT family transporter [Mesorhizobium sp. YIM 152430]MDF1599217.1 DMT family transporter [Mesorhizobium sp. YIM 152430]
MPLVIRLVPVIFVLLWSTGFIGARYAMPWAEPFAFLAVRFALTIALLALLLLAIRWRAMDGRQAVHAMIAGALMHGVYLGGVFWAIRNDMPAGLSALIVGLQPLATAMMAAVFLSEKLSARHWAGMALGLAGVAIVLAPKIGALGGVTAATLLSCFLAMLAISAGTVWQKRFVASGDLVVGTIWQYVGGVAVMLVATFAFETQTYRLTGELVFAMAWLVLVLSLGAIFLLMYLIREGEVAKVSSLFFLVPSVTALIAWLLFDETLNALQIGGMVLTTIGVAVATRKAQPGTRARASK